MKPLGIAFAVILSAGPAAAATSSGYAALAVGAIVGGYSPLLAAPQRGVLAKVFNGEAASAAGGAIHVNVDSIVCHAGDVDISAYRCDLKTGTYKVRITGRRANELFASLTDMGVASDGAAGTIYVSVNKLQCVIDPAKVAQKDGGGADCVYAVQ
jgi:hypothetical protein